MMCAPSSCFCCSSSKILVENRILKPFYTHTHKLVGFRGGILKWLRRVLSPTSYNKKGNLHVFQHLWRDGIKGHANSAYPYIGKDRGIFRQRGKFAHKHTHTQTGRKLKKTQKQQGKESNTTAPAPAAPALFIFPPCGQKHNFRHMFALPSFWLNHSQEIVSKGMREGEKSHTHKHTRITDTNTYSSPCKVIGTHE